MAEDCGLEVNSLVTVADAMKVKMYMKNFGEFYNDQIESAGTIILSRTQKTDAAKLDAAIDMIAGKNGKATIVTTPWDEIDGKQILATMESTVSLAEELKAEMEEDTIITITITKSITTMIMITKSMTIMTTIMKSITTMTMTTKSMTMITKNMTIMTMITKSITTMIMITKSMTIMTMIMKSITTTMITTTIMKSITMTTTMKSMAIIITTITTGMTLMRYSTAGALSLRRNSAKKNWKRSLRRLVMKPRMVSYCERREWFPRMTAAGCSLIWSRKNPKCVPEQRR